jgi:16S rRNA (guanine527-N7)-methyltransferase
MNAGTRLGPSARLDQGIRALKLQLPAAAAGQMLAYLAELHKWNAAYNLTAVRDPDEMVTRHLLDSLAVLPHLNGTRLLDAGSGAGLPGVPLALAQPELRVTLLDSGGKKARFLRHVQRQLNLENVEVVEARAEVFKPPVLFDTVISRAFGSLAEFLDSTAKLASAHGQWLAMKGKLDDQELENIPKGFVLKEIIPLRVPGLDEARHVVRVIRE